ncbi:MAG: SOS response-associated peptidase [Alphaproteobacteria bacterium]|nr:SOS response-associated peptidase [Alphaproteobacteria bacterium]
MCGRYAITLPPDAVRAFFRYAEQPNFPPRYNIAPTQPVPVVRAQRDAQGVSHRHFVLVRWGFLPGFVKDPKDFPLVINARSETAAEKASFRNALRRRRCIFIADAFYEWQRPGKSAGARAGAIPFMIRRRDGHPLALAGLWETWSGPDGEEVDSACILTTQANATVSAVHDRMPVIIEPEDFDRWLDTQSDDAGEAVQLMRPAGEDVLELVEISTLVNNVRNDNEEIQRPARRGASAAASTQSAQPAKSRARKPAAKRKQQDDLFG